MDVSPILNPLNDAQREAVTAAPGHYLVLAGAGSGKTRVLVHRIAWLIQAERVSPYGLLAVTFTNKAAGEMRGRVEALLDMPGRGLWVGTFHGIAHRLLRMHWQETGLPETFQILDAEDQRRLVKRVMQGMGIDVNQYPPRQVQWFINSRKDEGLRPGDIDPASDVMARQWLDVYEQYERQCRTAGLVDFAELLLRSHELWLQRPEILNHYRERFRHLLVDEFQDTNTIQYAWLRMLAGDTGKVFVVGDDDQSIYGWRGARVENVQRFTRDFPGVTTLRLEQNYRSTANILQAANALIAHNPDRLGKNLWTEGREGEPVSVYAAYNEQDEARFVVERIREWVEQGGALSECAILYRSNAQSRVFEEQLITEQMPYRVYGGLKFFERAEIKDALAYLRLMASRSDDAAFERIVNTPTRGIGERTVAAVRDAAREAGMSYWDAALRLVDGGGIAARSANALSQFMDLIHSMAQRTEGHELHEQVRYVIDASGLVDHYSKEPSERAESRLENLDELINAARSFALRPDDPDELDPLVAFLTHAALEAGENQADAGEDGVQLMTLHSAKGLEFPLVFLCGMEEGLFPHQRSLEEPGRLAEERRLCYVGITRAQHKLYVCHAETRRLHGQEHFSRPSRFVGELPPELVEEVRPRVQVHRPAGKGAAPAAPIEDMPLQLGQRVAHERFGEGVVLNCEGSGRHTRVQVNFEREGTKWLVLDYANLQTL